MKLLNVSELSEKTGLTQSFIRKQVFERTMPFLKIEGLVRFEPEEIKAWLRSKKVSGGQE